MATTKKQIVGAAILSLVFALSISNGMTADAFYSVSAPGMNAVIVFDKQQSLDEAQVTALLSLGTIGDDKFTLPVNAEVAVLESNLDKERVKVKILRGIHSGEIVWVPAFYLRGEGRLLDKNAKIDSQTGKPVKLALFRDAAALQKVREGGAFAMFMAAGTGECFFVPQGTIVEVISVGAPQSSITKVRIRDEGEYQNTNCLAASTYVVLEGKAKLFSPSSKEVTVFKTQASLDRVRQMAAKFFEKKIANSGFVVPNGTRVRVLGGEAKKKNVEIIDGDNKGKKGWVYAVWVQEHQSVSSSSQRGNKTLLPTFRLDLSGSNEIRVRNPNDFGISVGVRSGNKGRDFEVEANGVSSVNLPDGKYDIFFVYSDKPNALFQGDSFTLNGNGVEIQIVKVVNGNYGIRQVK
ncbi:hypothetical protein KA005_70645 [bacterium]|nr:hypothetical protein [bacterium]